MADPQPGDWADNENVLAWEESFGTIDLLELSSDQFVTGTQSLHVVTSTSAGVQGMHESFQTGLPVLGNPGEEMSLKAWVRSTQDFLFFTCQVRFLDEDHDFEGEVTFAADSGSADEWLLFEGSVTIPTGAAFWVPRVFWATPSGEVDIYIDAIEFEPDAVGVSIEAAPVSAIGAVQSVLAAISQAIQSVPVLGSFLAQPVSPSPAALNVPAVPSLLSGAVQPVSPVLDAKSIVSVPVLTSGGVQPVLPVMGAFSLETAPALGQGSVQPLQLALTGVGIPAAPVVANGAAVPILLGLGELRFASLSASLIGSSQPVLIQGGVITIQAETVASSLVALAGQLGLGSLSLETVPVLGQGEVRTVQPVSSEEPTLVTAEVAGVTGLSVPADVLLSSFSLLATPVQGLAAPQPVTFQFAEKLITASPAEGQAIASPIGVSLSELRIPGLPADASLQGMPTLIILDGKIIALVPADGVAAAVAMVVRSSELLIQAVVNARFVRQEAEGSFNRTVVPTRFGRIIVLGYKEPE